jgi:hypothetical protein
VTNAPPAAPQIHERYNQVIGIPLVGYRCECGYATGMHVELDCSMVEDLAALELRGHLLDEHAEFDWPFGRCSECGAVTDEFRAYIPGLGMDSWLCRQHAPKLPVVVDQAER